MVESESITSGLFWISTLVVVVIDTAFLWLLTRWIDPHRFRQLKWTLVGTAAVAWSAFAVILVDVFWETYYQYFYPDWSHHGGLLIFVPVVYGLFAWAFHWLSLHLPGHPILNFCLLTGVESLFEHIWGIYGMKVLQVSMLQNVSPASTLAFCFPEYIFYWCIILSMAILVHSGIQWWKNHLQSG